MAVEVTPQQALYLRDWLIEHIPDDVLTAEDKARMEQVSLHDVYRYIVTAGNPMACGPLDFVGWIPPFTRLGGANKALVNYTNAWYGDWEAFVTSVTKDIT